MLYSKRILSKIFLVSLFVVMVFFSALQPVYALIEVDPVHKMSYGLFSDVGHSSQMPMDCLKHCFQNSITISTVPFVQTKDIKIDRPNLDLDVLKSLFENNFKYKLPSTILESGILFRILKTQKLE